MEKMSSYSRLVVVAWVLWVLGCSLPRCLAQGLEPAPAAAPSGAVDLEAARALAKMADGARGAKRARALELAARAYDRCASRLDAPRSGAAHWAAAELWRRHGSLLCAEQAYLRAARADRRRYGQRALSGAADMQRRQLRRDAARKTYEAAEREDPATGAAQRARLWVGRMLLAEGKMEQATVRLQAALECASTPWQAIEAADQLAKAWICRGCLQRAAAVLAYVERLVEDHRADGPEVARRLRRASLGMSARKALQRALDVKHKRGADAVKLDAHRRLRSERAAPPPKS